MRENTLIVTIILILGISLSACQNSAPETESPSSALPNTSAPILLPTATETAAVLTNTPEPSLTPEPSPSPTPAPYLPENLALLTYRTLGQVELLATLPLSDVIDLEISPDGNYLRARVNVDDDTHQDIFFDLMTGTEVFQLEGGQRIYFSSEGPLITSLDGTEIAVVNLISGEQETIYSGEFLASALSPDGQILVALEYEERGGVGTTFHVFDLPGGEERYSLYVNGTIPQESFGFDQDGENMAAAYFVPPGTYVASVWAAKTGIVLYTEYGFTEIVLHPFGSEAALSSSRRSYISLVSTCTWEQRVYLGSAEDEPGYYRVEYADKGRLIYALSDRETIQAYFWYPPSGEWIDLDLGPDLLAVTISPDRRLVASSDQSGLIKIWGILE